MNLHNLIKLLFQEMSLLKDSGWCHRTLLLAK